MFAQRLITPMLLIVLACGCTSHGIFAKRQSELNCPTDIRQTIPWCAGEDAVFRCPCGPDGAFYGHRPTCWRTWPAPATVWRDSYCGPTGGIHVRPDPYTDGAVTPLPVLPAEAGPPPGPENGPPVFPPPGSLPPETLPPAEAPAMPTPESAKPRAARTPSNKRLAARRPSAADGRAEQRSTGRRAAPVVETVALQKSPQSDPLPPAPTIESEPIRAARCSEAVSKDSSFPWFFVR